MLLNGENTLFLSEQQGVCKQYFVFEKEDKIQEIDASKFFKNIPQKYLPKIKKYIDKE